MIGIFLLILLSNGLFAQNRYGQIAITVGPTYNMLRGVYKLPFINYDKSFKFTLGQQVHLDYAFFRRMSLGFGVTHQKQNLTIHNYQYFDGPAIITESPVQITNTLSSYVRALFHVLPVFEDSDEMLDVYIGGAQTFTYYSATNNSNDPDFYAPSSGVFTFFNAIAGVRFYPIEKLGIFFEAALPIAYTFSAGITFRAFGRDRLIRKGTLNRVFEP